MEKRSLVAEPSSHEVAGADKSVPVNLHILNWSERTAKQNLQVVLFLVLACLFWLYFVVNTFVYSIDLLILGLLPTGLAWLVHFKFVVLLSVGVVSLRYFSRQQFWFYLFYFLFFPLIQICKLPFIIIKSGSWTFGIAVINLFIGLFINAKRNFQFFAYSIIAWALTLFASNYFLLWLAVILSVYLAMYQAITTILDSSRPSRVVEAYLRMASSIKKFGEDKFFSPDFDIRSLPVEDLSSSQLEQYHTKLDYAVVFAKFCVFASGKMLQFQRSEWRLFPSIFAAAKIIGVSVFLFSLAYYALYKSIPVEFRVIEDVGYFDFLYFSFNNLGFNAIEQVVAVGKVSRSIFMLQCTVFVFVLAIFVSAFTSARDEDYTRKLSEVSAGFKALSKDMEKHITRKFGTSSFEDAVSALLKVRSGLLSLFLKLSGEVLAAAEDEEHQS